MKIVECLQGSEEWRAVRAGNITASRMSDVLAKLKNPKNGKVDTQARANYKAQLIAEILTGEPQDDLLSLCFLSLGALTLKANQFAHTRPEFGVRKEAA